MKFLRVIAVAIMALAFFSSAKAQVVVRARIGGQPHHRREVIVHRPYHRPYHRGYHHHREVIVVRHR